MFFEGTRTEEKVKNPQGEWEEMSLLKSWYAIRDHFDNALQDISELESEKAKTKLQDWFDVLSKVMKLWQLGQDGKLPNSLRENGDKSKREEVDDFYIFLFDEEETEYFFRQGRKFTRKRTERVLAFWCFNAGIAFKQIQAL